MSRMPGWVACIALIVGIITSSEAAPAPAPAPTTAAATVSPAEATLKAKGLTRVGTTFVLDADAKLPEQLRKMRAAKRQLEEHARKRQNLEADIRKADAATAQLMREYTDLKSRLYEGMPARDHNRLADQINARVANLKEAETFHDNKEKELKALVEPRDDYVSALLEVSDAMEETAKQYETIAKDPEVATAIDKYNATAKPKARLGPSAQFAAELTPVRQMRKMLDASSIPLTMSGGVPHVDVTLNGTVAQRMVLDSGAGIVSITTELAEKLGMKPAASDPKVTLVVADGRKTEARMMTIKRVRVGQFSVENVECAVLPPEVKGDNNLLGGTFLEHFVYRMDLGAQRLHLSQVGGKPTTPEKPAKATAPEREVVPGTATAASGPAALAPASQESPAGVTPAAASQPSLAGEGVELLDSMTGDTGRKEDGAIVLNDGERIQSPQKFKPPVSFRIVAQTNANDLRIGAMADQIIFNWRDNPKELRIDGGPANGRHKPDAGQIPVNQWVQVQIDVTKSEMVIAVDGQRRHRVQTSFARASRPLVIFPAVGSTIKVKSVRVVEK